jgi:hypothetical protein
MSLGGGGGHIDSVSREEEKQNTDTADWTDLHGFLKNK